MDARNPVTTSRRVSCVPPPKTPGGPATIRATCSSSTCMVTSTGCAPAVGWKPSATAIAKTSGCCAASVQISRPWPTSGARTPRPSRPPFAVSFTSAASWTSLARSCWRWTARASKPSTARSATLPARSSRPCSRTRTSGCPSTLLISPKGISRRATHNRATHRSRTWPRRSSPCRSGGASTPPSPPSWSARARARCRSPTRTAAPWRLTRRSASATTRRWRWTPSTSSSSNRKSPTWAATWVNSHPRPSRPRRRWAWTPSGHRRPGISQRRGHRRVRGGGHCGLRAQTARKRSRRQPRPLPQGSVPL